MPISDVFFFTFDLDLHGCNKEIFKQEGSAQISDTSDTNESQKAVMIDMMKSVGEIASKMWPVV